MSYLRTFSAFSFASSNNSRTFVFDMSDFAEELSKLHELTGADFSRQVERIAHRGEFYPLDGETGIFVTGGERQSDFPNLLNAARKAVAHGYEVYILPNPKGVRTPDFILSRQGIYRVYDLKTISGKASVSNRLEESIGQARRVILNMRAGFNTRLLTENIQAHFMQNADVTEVIVFRGMKMVSVKRNLALSKHFAKRFRRMYE
ncbi:MAG: hypothetical protein IJ155_08510 [Prevotella sp.]|nr:hypothetical protein [Prevotella sp.]